MHKSVIKWAVIAITCVAIILICSQSASAAPRLSSIGPGGPEDLNSGGPAALEQRQRDGAKSPEELLTAANEDIKAKLIKVIESINTGKSLESDMAAQIKQSLMNNKKYLVKMSNTDKANYHMLSAWSLYFSPSLTSGQKKAARNSAMAAFQSDKRDTNTRVTLIAMTLVNDDIKSLKAVLAMTKSQAATSANADGSAPAPQTTSSLGATLDFNPDSIVVDMIGQKIGEIQAKCINGANFDSKDRKMLFLIVWDLVSTGNAQSTSDETDSSTPAPMAPMMDTTNSQQVPPMQVFGDVFSQHYNNDKIAFLGINIDNADAAGDVVRVLMKNPWPWAQAMANDSANTSLSTFAKTKLKSPMLVVVSGDGTVMFAGSAAGVLPRVIAQHGSKASPKATEKTEGANGAIAAPANEETKSAETANSPSPAGADSNTQAAAEETPAPRAYKSEEEQLNPQASNLYQFAVSQMKTGRITGYKKVVDACRRVINEFPDTPEAQKSRELLRRIPSDKKRLYKITNEEQGL